jgi:N-acetylmuramoyl-L-alanine amidase
MMTATRIRLIAPALVAAAVLALGPPRAEAQTARTRYTDAQAREAKVRAALAAAAPTTTDGAVAMAEARKLIAAYIALVARFPISGYADNALLNAAGLADTLNQQFGQSQDRLNALKLYKRVGAEYPASSLIKQSEAAIARLDAPAAALPAAATSTGSEPATAGRARLTSIERSVLPESVRITIGFDREVAYREETLSGPARVFFDMKDVEAVPDLSDAVLRYPTDAVRQIRVGRHPNSTVRVVLDLEGVSRHSSYALYNPFRLVIDCEPGAATTAARNGAPAAPETAAPVRVEVAAPTGPAPATPTAAAAVDLAPTVRASEGTAPVAAKPTTAPAAAPPAPEAPNANRAGGFSIARQLGLGVSRIVIDPGHGGHDPGSQGKGLSEAELTLDVALRLEKLLQKEPGIDVVLTRRGDEYVGLAERTDIANRESADLFLSIHANASKSPAARGVETYYLSFASEPEAEAVAARENAGHAGEMHTLPDIIKAIALNNKLDESRDFAGMVQEAMVSRLRRSNDAVRNRGIRKAPFLVLIGASMPSVLAEISFMTNKQELQLLKTSAYKQRIAEALHAAVMRYRRSLKGTTAIAAQ